MTKEDISPCSISTQKTTRLISKVSKASPLDYKRQITAIFTLSRTGDFFADPTDLLKGA